MKNRIISIVLSLLLVIGLVPITTVSVFAAEETTVVVSMEGLTLGQGMYFKPKAYTIDEINNLVASEGYGPYTKDELTAGIATLAFLIDNNVEYSSTGSWDSDAYLSGVKGIDTGVIAIPAVISENGGPSNEVNDGNADDYLGEFDYSMESGWMITVNDFMIDKSCAAWVFADSENMAKCPTNLGSTYVVRWQFTLSGFGADLGVDTGWGMTPYFQAASKASLYAAYAQSGDSAKKASALPVMENLTAAQSDVDAALAELTKTETETDTDTDKFKYEAVLNDTLAQLAADIPAPAFGTSGGEWTVISLARGGYYNAGNQYFEDYYGRVAETVPGMEEKALAAGKQAGALDKNKSTENSRLIMALSAIGKDPTNVGGVNVLGAYDANGFDWIKKQGINGPIFTLIALDTKNYQTTDNTLRQQCIDFILGKELSGGGWALSGTAADPDITSMALQALANYKNDANVSAAASRAIDALSAMQKDNGGFASWGSVNSESIAQVITALSAWGIDADKDSRFVKDGGSALDALLTFYIPEGKGFAHVLTSGGGYTGGEVNGMATDQASYALVAYDRFVNGKTALYDMSDVGGSSEIGELTATLTLPEKVENKAGTLFNAVINLNGFLEDYRLLDSIITIPEGVAVTDVTMGSRIGGGEVSWYVEEETGKLRIVYFDAQDGNVMTDSGKDYPLELMTIGLALEKAMDADSVSVAISGMSMKKNSDSETQIIINTASATDTVKLVEGISFSAMILYTGDDIDLIPASKTAIAVAVTGIQQGTKLTYNDGTDSISMLYNAAVSEKTGVSTYIAIIASDKALNGFIDSANYTFGTGNADAMTFGDTNSDGIINAQDALNTVNYWLRKIESPNDNEILATNVTGDSRINTFDALGIVEYFVDGSEFAIVNYAATVKNAVN